MKSQRELYDERLNEVRLAQGEQSDEVETDEQRAARLERELNSLAVYSAMVGAS